MVKKTVAPIEDRDVKPPPEETVGAPSEPPPRMVKRSERRRERERAAKKRREATAADIGEVPPEPLVAKFPGEAPPYPPGYTPPEGKAVEFDAKGRPTVIETSAGLRQYTPNSTMFKMGYLNSDQYLKSGVARGDKTVDATAFLPITSETGESLMMDKEVAFALQSKKPKEQFKAMQEMGIIETGSRFIAAKDGKWSYQTARSVTREAKFIKESAIYDQALHVSLDFKKSHIDLGNGQWVAIKDWNKLQGKYQTIGIRQGFDAMNTAMLKDAKDFREVNTRLPDGNWFGNADLMAINASSPDLYTILTEKGYGGYEEALAGAKTTLGDFYDKQKDSYDVAGALLKRKPDLTNAVNILFDQKDVDRITFEHLPGLTIGTKAERSAALDIVPGLAVAGIVTAATPTPFDNIVYYTAVGGLAIGTWIAARALKNYMNKTGRAPTPADIVVVDKKGNFTTALQLYPKLQQIPPLVPPEVTLTGEVIKAPPAIFPQTVIKKIELPAWKEGVKGVSAGIETVFLPTPATTMEDLTGKQGGLMAAQAAVEVAEKNLKAATQTIEINWPKILAELNEAKKQKDIKAVFATWNLPPQEAATAVKRRFDFAANDYLRKRMVLESARQSYVASINPTPLTPGKVTPEVLDDYAAFAISDAISPSIASATRQGVSAWVDAYNKAIAKGLTTTQAKAAAESATRSAISQAIKTMAQTKVMTQTQIQALTRTMTQAAVRTATRAIPATRTAVRPMTRVATATATATATGKVPPPPFLLPRGGTDKQKRKAIKAAAGAIAWRQGELKGKDIWRVVISPYDKEEYWLTVVGRKPVGATLAKGPRSAYQSLTLVKGRPPAKRVTADMGIMDVTLDPVGIKKIGIGFKPDPKGLTTGDIKIGRKMPKVPKLRR